MDIIIYLLEGIETGWPDTHTDENCELEPDKHIGVFKKLLQFRIDAGDIALKNHLDNAPHNATNISPIIQNEIIEACNRIILTKLVKKVNTSKAFVLVADETADISNIEQLSISVRYIDIDKLIKK